MNFIDYSDLEITKLWNDYANTRNKGLKKIANNKLNKMIEFVNSKEYLEKKEFVDYLCNEKFENENIENFQQPLIANLILPVIIPMVNMEQMPYLRWIYQLKINDSSIYKEYHDLVEYYNSEEILIKANKIAHRDIKTVTLLIDMYMSSLWYGSHHLPEFILIDEKDVDYLLSKLSELVKKYGSDINCIDEIYRDIKYYKNLYESWFTYKHENLDITFDEWCKRNNKHFSWTSAYYYE